MRYLLYTYLLLTVTCLKSQDFKQDLIEVVSQQQKLAKQCYRLTYTLRENYLANSKVLHVSLGKYIKTKSGFLSSIDYLTSLTLNESIIMIDSEKKQMVVSKNEKKESPQLDLLKQLESYNKNVEKITPTQLSKNQHLYTVELKKSLSPIAKYELVLDTKTKSLVRITFFYKSKLAKDIDYKITGKEIPRLDIEFFDYNNFEKLKEIECEKTFYYTQENTKIIPTEKFKDYEVKKI